MSLLGEDVCVETTRGVTRLIAIGTDLGAHIEQYRVFSTAEDNQTAVGITLLARGPGPPESTRVIGRVNLTGIEAAPRGVPQIQLRVKITADGRLEAKARDPKSGNISASDPGFVAVMKT